MRIISLVVAASLGGALTCGCKTREAGGSEAKEFQSAEAQGGTVEALKLKRAGAIKHVIYRQPLPVIPGDINGVPGLAGLRSHLEAAFPDLTEAQYNALKAVYGGDKTSPWQAGKHYDLRDFVPPAIQALVGTRFLVQLTPDASLPTDYKKLTSTTNCWNAVWEVLRGSKASSHVFYIDPTRARSALEDPAYSRPVKELSVAEASPAAAATRNAGVQPRDVLLIFSPAEEDEQGRAAAGTLVHAALFVDDDFYFEKTSPDDFSTYRFVGFNDIAGLYPARDGYRYFIRRFDQAPVPDPKDLFSIAASPDFQRDFAKYYSVIPAERRRFLTFVHGRGDDADDSFFLIKEIKLQLNAATGRYELEPAAYQKDAFRF